MGLHTPGLAAGHGRLVFLKPVKACLAGRSQDLRPSPSLSQGSAGRPPGTTDPALEEGGFPRRVSNLRPRGDMHGRDRRGCLKGSTMGTRGPALNRQVFKGCSQLGVQSP